MAAMKDASSVVRFHAAKGLEALGWHPENNLQQAVFWVALGQLEKAAGLGAIAIEPLTLMLRDRYYYKRQAALEAVSRIDDARVPKLVRDALRDNDRNVRLSAVEMLANIRDPLSVDPLIKAIQSTDSHNPGPPPLPLWENLATRLPQNRSPDCSAILTGRFGSPQSLRSVL